MNPTFVWRCVIASLLLMPLVEHQLCIFLKSKRIDKEEGKRERGREGGREGGRHRVLIGILNALTFTLAATYIQVGEGGFTKNSGFHKRCATVIVNKQKRRIGETEGR